MKWFAVFVFNLIALVAFITHVNMLMEGGVSGGPTYVKWAVSAISINFAVATLAVLANKLAGTKFAATPIEGGLVSLKLAAHGLRFRKESR